MDLCYTHLFDKYVFCLSDYIKYQIYGAIINSISRNNNMSGKHISLQAVRDVLEMGNGCRHDTQKISDYRGEKEREGSWRVKKNGEAV